MMANHEQRGVTIVIIADTGTLVTTKLRRLQNKAKIYSIREEFGFLISRIVVILLLAMMFLTRK